MKKILIALVAISLTTGALFADTTATKAPAAKTATTAAATTPAASVAAPAAQAEPLTVNATIVKIVAASKSKGTPAEIVVKGADDKKIVLVIAKASSFKNASGKAIKRTALKAGEAVSVVYTSGEKRNTLVSITLAK